MVYAFGESLPDDLSVKKNFYKFDKSCPARLDHLRSPSAVPY